MKKIYSGPNVTVNSNKDELLDTLRDAVPVILTDWGMTAERYAKDKCPVDTGRLKNSITWAISGRPANITEYRGNDTHGRTATTIRNGTAGKPAPKPRDGTYSGTAPDDPEDKLSVYIGTNVKYAPYVELGTSKMRKPQPFIRPAIANHINEYKDILKNYLLKIGMGFSVTE